MPGGQPGAQIVQARITYLKPSEVLLVSDRYGVNGYGLFTSDLLNQAGFFRRPSGPNAAAAFFTNPSGTLLAPDTKPDGSYDPSPPGDRSRPEDWVYSYRPSEFIADPEWRTAYPIVTTANYVGYHCYRSGTVSGVLKTYLSYYQSAAGINSLSTGVLAQADTGPLPLSWRLAIRDTFVTNASGLGLQIGKVGLIEACTRGGIVRA